MKKKVLIVVDILLILILIIASIYTFIYFTRPDNVKFKQEYEALNDQNVKIEVIENNPIKYIKLEEALDILQNKTGVIYFGFPGCPWCRNMLPILFETTKNNNVDTIYYFNPKDVKNNDDKNYEKLIEILSEYLDSNENGEKVLYVPDVYFVKNGNIMGHHLGTVESQNNPYEEMTNDQKQELKDIFNELFESIK